MADAIQQYGSISLGGRGGVNQGILKFTAAGLAWKGPGGGKSVDAKKDDIVGFSWTKVSRDYQLAVHRRDAPTLNYLGFKEKDFEALSSFCQSAYGKKLEELRQATTGRNWGALSLKGASLVFSIDGAVGFDLPLPDVIQAQSLKDDLIVEMALDDTAGTDKEDALVEVSFHVPSSCQDWEGTGPDNPPAKVLLDAILHFTDAGPGGPSTAEAVCVFEEVAVLVPRGRFEVELHMNHLKMVGQTQEFKIRYTSITRIFILPKPNTPHTAVVISVDPPIRKGQTYYSHLLCQFPSDQEVKYELSITPEQLAAKNEKCGGKLQEEMSGLFPDVFARILRGLSGAKLTRPGNFKNAAGDSPSVRCSYKADEGHLYPMERAFFYIHKPPMLLPYEDIDSVEFQRQGGGVIASSVRTFDLVVRLKNGQEHQFRSIQRSEWEHLFQFINSKKLRIDNLAAAKQGPGGPGMAVDVGDDMDPGMRNAAMEADSEEDDEDFEGGDGSGSGSDDGGSDEGEDSSDAEMIEEEGISVAAVTGKGKKRAAEPKAAPAPKKPKPPVEKGPSPAKGKKEKKKKDPAAPKKGLTAFMFYSNQNRERVKTDNPGISFGEIGKVLGEQWKALDSAGKSKYEAMAEVDKQRYSAAMAKYTAEGANGQ